MQSRGDPKPGGKKKGRGENEKQSNGNVELKLIRGKNRSEIGQMFSKLIV